MVAFAWERLNRSIIGQKYTLDRLISVSDDQAWFEANRRDAPGERVSITCFPEEGFGPFTALDDFEHTHLRTVLQTGREAIRGREVRSVVMGRVDGSLSD